MTLADLNARDAAGFVDALSGLFEHSPWIPERVAGQRPFDSLTALHAAMTAAVEAAGEEGQLALLRNHPDLAGRAAVAGELTEASSGEQASAGLDSLSEDEMARFQELNGRYRERFGFPFIKAVRGADKARILAAFEGRVDTPWHRELATALHEVGKIAWLRLLSTVEPAPTGKLTTHVLDTAGGCPAARLPLALWYLDADDGATRVGDFVTNDDGRLAGPALQGADVRPGLYQWVFEAGVYFARAGHTTTATPFLDRIPLSFGISNPEAHYHVPLLLSPWSISIYRGS
nr:2-oxo-4-hydroxy-4-carboxy-5-ureidoimidazoline decarboxylase [Rhodovibrio sodomensis]